MPPKKTTPAKPAPKKATPTKPPAGRGTTGSSRTTKQVVAAAGPGKKAVPVKGKTPTGNSKGSGVKSPPTGGTLKKRVWTEKDTMARKIQNAFRTYSCRKKLQMLKKKKEEFDTLMETLEREVIIILHIYRYFYIQLCFSLSKFKPMLIARVYNSRL